MLAGKSGRTSQSSHSIQYSRTSQLRADRLSEIASRSINPKPPSETRQSSHASRSCQSSQYTRSN